MTKLTRGQLWYRTEHLDTQWWEYVKQEVIKRDGYHCSMKNCSGFTLFYIVRYPLHFHHLSYDRLKTEEEIQDVVIVCLIHHYLCHHKLFRQVKMTRKDLTKRFLTLKRASWRRCRPSDIINWFIDQYKID